MLSPRCCNEVAFRQEDAGERRWGRGRASGGILLMTSLISDVFGMAQRCCDTIRRRDTGQKEIAVRAGGEMDCEISKSRR